MPVTLASSPAAETGAVKQRFVMGAVRWDKRYMQLGEWVNDVIRPRLEGGTS